MKIIIIRHGEPDFEHNTLTKKGFEEARALSEYLKKKAFDEAYTSPIPRARLTAEAVMKYHNIPLVEEKWLEEFIYPVNLPYKENAITWDILPEYFTSNKEFYNNDTYLDIDFMKQGHIKEKYNYVINKFDEILCKNGYQRFNNYYQVTVANKKTLVFFCHFGMMCVLMSHLLNIPYVVLAHNFICPPSGMTVLNSEERRKGVANFRCWFFGATPHLDILNMDKSTHGRFCEIYDSNDRHD